MKPIEMFISVWYTAGGFTLILELSKWGRFWHKFDEMEKVPEARIMGGVAVVIIFIIVICTFWPVRIYWFTRRLVDYLWTKTK